MPSNAIVVPGGYAPDKIRMRHAMVELVAAAVALVALQSAAGGQFDDSFRVPGVESQRAADLLKVMREAPTAMPKTELVSDKLLLFLAEQTERLRGEKPAVDEGAGGPGAERGLSAMVEA